MIELVGDVSCFFFLAFPDDLRFRGLTFIPFLLFLMFEFICR